MLYKTIVLELLQSRPTLYEQLLASRTLLPTLERMSLELKAGYQSAMEQLAQANPTLREGQIAAAAREIALEELQKALPSESPPDESETLSLDAAMAFITRPTPLA